MSNESRPTIRELPDIVTCPNTIQKIIQKMEKYIGDDSSGHDLDHAWRVFNLAIRIADIEGADMEVVGASALTHDIHRSMGENDQYVPPEDSLPEVHSILEQADFSKEKIQSVLHCVEVHEQYQFKGEENPAQSKEALILQDADNLDAIGAIGIARNFAFTGVIGNRLWAPNTNESSGLDHFYDKLLHLREEMNTETAQTLAKERHEYLEQFAERFKSEWHGEI